MGRKSIPLNQRSIPISFSVKPHLAEKIDEYSHQLRFSKSKFLAQAVTEAITKIEMGYDLSDFDVRNMNDTQKLAIALNTLNEPTPTQEINLNVARILRDKLNDLLSVEEAKAKFNEYKETKAKWREITATEQPRIIDVKRLEAGQYSVIDTVSGDEVGHIFKDLNRTERPWVFSNHLDGATFSSRTLADAKDVAQEELEA